MSVALPDPVTGEIVRAEPLDFDEAQVLTAKIKGYVSQAWRLLVIAYERQAHKALRYETWEQYVGEEFGISRSRSYQLLDMAYVVREIESVVGTITEVEGDVSTSVDITEAMARDIKPVIDEVKEEIVAALEADVADVPPAEIVAEVIEKKRAEKKEAGGSNRAAKGGAEEGATDPPADLSAAAAALDARDQEEHATTRYREDFTKAVAKTYGQLLTLSPEKALEDGDRDFRRSIAVLSADLRKFANACDAALNKSQRLRSV